MKKWIIALSALLIVVGIGGYAFLNSMQIFASTPVYAEGGLAIQGYDPVAYFKQSKAVAGEQAHSMQWNGATWLFSTEKNLAAFAVDPAAYAPQFGGYCAYAVASGYTAKTDPTAWHIEQGKLYLNFDAATQQDWLAGIRDNIEAGDTNWPAVIND